MRPTFLVYLALAAFLTGCAVEGVVVEKNSRPLPFFDSVGMDGVYKLKLRDSQGNISSQMVTPEVFAQVPESATISTISRPPCDRMFKRQTSERRNPFIGSASTRRR